MNIEQNISLKSFNTFGIDVLAKHYTSVMTIAELKNILSLKEYKKKFILGGGSNMLLTKDVDALVVHNNIKGISIISEDNDHVVVEANAGENWHDFVLWCLKQNYGGLENLSLIPGNVGTAPIQNIGAYGVELKDTMLSCEALEIESLTMQSFQNVDCNFSYRNSIFKQEKKNKYVICSVTFKLTKQKHKLHTSYGDISKELEDMKVKLPTIQDISHAIISIRERKLPNPKKIGNSGSFFKNPIISIEHYQNLKSKFSNIPSYIISKNEVKVPAGWLIEKAGFKGKRFGNYGVHKKQALVLVNYGGANGKDITDLSKLIQKTIKRLFNISIEPEVNIL